MQIIKLTILISFVCIFPANAYIGPGIGAGIIATIIGFILTILVALFVIIYPIKKIISRIKKRKEMKILIHITTFNCID